MSTALDFGHALLTNAQYDDVCDQGRILLPDSIAFFDEDTDILSMSFSIADASTKVADIRGIRKLISDLPHFTQLPSTDLMETTLQRLVTITEDICYCSIRSVTDYAIKWTSVLDRSRSELRDSR